MKIGNKTVQYSVYGEINNKLTYLDDTTSLQLPSFEMLSDTVKGPGIMGEIDWPSYLGVGSAQFTFNMRTDEVKAAYLSAPGKKRFEVRWVTDKFDTSGSNIGIDSHKVVIIGVSKKYDAGKVEVNAASDGSNDFEVLYYKKSVNGKEIIEIDKLNYIYRVNGVDYGKNIKSLL